MYCIDRPNSLIGCDEVVPDPSRDSLVLRSLPSQFALPVLRPYWPGNDLAVSLVLAPPLSVVAVNCSPIVDDGLGLRVTQKNRYSQLNSSVDKPLREHEFRRIVQCYGDIAAC